MIIEQNLLTQIEPDKRRKLLEKLDSIEDAVNKMKVPASLADQFYGLRGHIRFVHEKMMSENPPSEKTNIIK
jgi:hypothetical protein